MMKEKINDTEPGIKQIEREIERGCDNAKKYFWLFVVFFAAGLIVRNVMHDFFSAGRPPGMPMVAPCMPAPRSKISS